MELILEKTGIYQVIKLAGRLDTTTSDSTKQRIDEIIKEGETNLIIDCSKMDYISSTGLRVFLSALKKLNSNDGSLRIAGLQESIKQIFDISGFTKLFKIYKDLDSAINK
jgi:anti-anti-sigma factor